MEKVAKQHQLENKLATLKIGATRVDEGVVYPSGVLNALDRLLGLIR